MALELEAATLLEAGLALELEAAALLEAGLALELEAATLLEAGLALELEATTLLEETTELELDKILISVVHTMPLQRESALATLLWNKAHFKFEEQTGSTLSTAITLCGKQVPLTVQIA